MRADLLSFLKSVASFALVAFPIRFMGDEQTGQGRIVAASLSDTLKNRNHLKKFNKTDRSNLIEE